MSQADQHAQRQARYSGMGDGLSLSIELVVVPTLFGLLGWWLDGVFGIRPVLFVILLVGGVVGAVARVYFAYAISMTVQEKGKPWTRSRP